MSTGASPKLGHHLSKEIIRPFPSPRTKHLVGWTVIADFADANAIRETLARCLDGFIGDFGSIRTSEVAGGIGFGFWKPETALPMTTWSFFRDGGRIGFIEGLFYDDFGSHRIMGGEDPGLARALADAFGVEGERAIARLSGSFAGYFFDLRTSTLTTFVDRLGTKALYWSRSKQGVIVSSNLASFRSVIPLKLSCQAAFQFLTVGFPIGEMTLLDGVFMQPPASTHTFSKGSYSTSRYWVGPARENGLPLRKAVGEIAGSMEDCVARVGRRAGGRLGLGFSGGHDSRLIFSSLLYKSVPFQPLSWRGLSFDDRIVPELCSLARKEFHFALPWASEDLPEVRQRAFVYSDGQHLYSFGFSLLGRLCLMEGLDTLLLGFGGDILSGFTSHLHVRSLRELARRTLKKHMEFLSFRDAETLLADVPRGVATEALSLWMESFESEARRGSIPDVSIWQQLQNRNFKRVWQSMHPASQYVQIVYPYLDSAVMDVYFRLPLHFLDQKPHCYAGFYRYPEFGAFQASPFRVSLRMEARFPWTLYLLRLLSADVRALRSVIRRPPRRSAWSAPDRSAFDEVARSPLFDSRRLDELVAKRRIKVVDLRKMQTLSQFDRFYVRGDNSVIPPSYLSR